MLYRAGKEPAAAPPIFRPPSFVTGPQPTVLNSVDLAPATLKGDRVVGRNSIHCQAHFGTWAGWHTSRNIRWLPYLKAGRRRQRLRHPAGYRAIDPRLFRLVQFSAPPTRSVPTTTSGASGDNCTGWPLHFYDRPGMAGYWWNGLKGSRPPLSGGAYSEINRFERQLVEHGIILLKFWMHISKEEQSGASTRQNTAHKQHKLTDDDWRNREKWHEYELAVDQMVSRTSTHHAPWTLVAGNSKALRTHPDSGNFCRTIGSALEA